MKSEYLWQGGRERSCRPQDDISLSAPVNSILPPLKNHRVCQGYVTCHTDLHHDMLQTLTQREERWERRREDTFTHTELSWFSQNLHAEKHEPQWSNYQSPMDKIRSCPTFFNFVIQYNCIATMSWRLPCFHINYQNNKTMKMNFAMIVRPKNLMILKKWGATVGKDQWAHIRSIPSGVIDPESLTSHDGKLEPERITGLDNSLLF